MSNFGAVLLKSRSRLRSSAAGSRIVVLGGSQTLQELIMCVFRVSGPGKLLVRLIECTMAKSAQKMAAALSPTLGLTAPKLRHSKERAAPGSPFLRRTLTPTQNLYLAPNLICHCERFALDAPPPVLLNT